MIAAAYSTWILLRRPALAAAGVGAVAAFAVAVATATFLTAARPGGSRFGATPLFLHDLGGAGIPAELIGRILMITGAVSLAVAAAHVGGSFQSGLVRTLFVRQPDRIRWLLGTWLTLCGVTTALTVIGAAVVVCTGALLASAYGVDASAWSSVPAVQAATVRTLAVAVALIGFTTAGVALAVLTRSAITATGIGLAYGLFEGLAAATLGDAGRYLPAQNFAVVSRGLADPGFATASVASVGLIAGSLAIAAVILRRRDVTD